MPSNLDELSQPTDRIAMDKAPLPFFERLKSGVGHSRRFDQTTATSGCGLRLPQAPCSVARFAPCQTSSGGNFRQDVFGN
jgi:hypothetical protein